ncbi:MAG: hypothetical protein JWN86_294 [Planctomycetota bacterium]|nr:hypothetical protein [Planctomycetota bacterium]
MITTFLAASRSPASPSAAARPRLFGMTAVAIAMLIGSGVMRHFQDRRLNAAAVAVKSSPFRLESLPRDLGGWRAEGEDQRFDAETLSIVGCTDYVARDYVDVKTGVMLSVLVAFGPAERIVSHTPELCMPATGYARAGESLERALEIPGSSARFRSLVFGKGDGSAAAMQEVFYAFRHEGTWSPDASESRKRFRNRPEMFKVQIQRAIAAGELRGVDNPSEALLQLLLPEIESRLKSRSGREARSL